MPDTPTITLSALVPTPVLIILCIAVIGFSIWSYRRTWPPVGPVIRTILIVLRSISLTAAVLFLAHLQIERIDLHTEPASVALLIDKSASMGLEDAGINRQERMMEVLRSKAYQRFDDRYSVEYFTFSDSGRYDSDDLWAAAETVPDRVGTNLVQAWLDANAELSDHPPSAVILMSDGAHNTGPDPARLARNSKQPIWTIGIGSSDPVKDLMVLGVVVNHVVYQGSTVPVEVNYRCIGADGVSLALLLKNAAGKIAGIKRFTPGSDYEEGTASFDLVVDEAGKRRYTSEITTLEGELTADNNRRSFYLNVLSNKMRVLVMAGHPDNGLGDLIRRLKKDDQIKIIQRTTHSGGFYEGDWLSDDSLAQIDVVIMHHFPVRETDRRRLERFAGGLIEHNLPVCFIDGSEVEHRLLREFRDILPLEIRITRTRSGAGQVHPVVRHAIVADPDQSDYAGQWNGLPPLAYNKSNYTPTPQAKVLAEFHDSKSMDKEPALLVVESGGQKSVVFFGWDLWKWGLASPGGDGFLEPFLGRLIRWLAVRKVEKRVDLQFDRDLYSNQEPVEFTAIVRNESYIPVDDAVVEAAIMLQDTVGGKVALEGLGEGRYRGSFRPWADGEYSVVASAVVDGEAAGTDRGRVTIEPFNIELLNSRMNEDLLRAVGEFSGGGYAPILKADSLFKSIYLPPDDRENVNRWELWGKAWMLAVVIGLLASEWFIRIRLGML